MKRLFCLIFFVRSASAFCLAATFFELRLSGLTSLSLVLKRLRAEKFGCVFVRLIVRRVEIFLPRIFLQSIYFFARTEKLYIGLSSFYQIFNPWEMNCDITHLPFLNFRHSLCHSSLGRSVVHRSNLPCIFL